MFATFIYSILGRAFLLFWSICFGKWNYDVVAFLMSFLRLPLFTLIYYLFRHLRFCKTYEKCLVAKIKIITVFVFILWTEIIFLIENWISEIFLVQLMFWFSTSGKVYPFWVCPINNCPSRKYFLNTNKINSKRSFYGGRLLRRSGIRCYFSTKRRY